MTGLSIVFNDHPTYDDVLRASLSNHYIVARVRVKEYQDQLEQFAEAELEAQMRILAAEISDELVPCIIFLRDPSDMTEKEFRVTASHTFQNPSPVFLADIKAFQASHIRKLQERRRNREQGNGQEG